MRAFLVTGPGELALLEVEPPRPGPGEVVLEIRAALTCGTDLKLLRRGHPKFPFPTGLGHEFSGVVVEAGPGARFPVGTELMSAPTAPCGSCALCTRGRENLCDEAMRGMTMGAFADRLLLPASIVSTNAFEKPPGLSFEHAAFLEPLACAVQGIDEIGVGPGDSVVVLGAGPIGLLFLQLARARGAARVVCVGRRAARLEAARALGADLVLDETMSAGGSLDEAGGGRPSRVSGDLGDAVREATSGLGADVVIECVGQPSAWEQAVSLVRRGGRVLWFGGCARGTAVSLDTERVHYDAITVMGVFHYTPRAVAEARRLLVEGRVDLTRMLSGSMPLERLPEALERFGRGEGVKYALVP